MLCSVKHFFLLLADPPHKYPIFLTISANVGMTPHICQENDQLVFYSSQSIKILKPIQKFYSHVINTLAQKMQSHKTRSPHPTPPHPLVSLF